MVYVMLADGFEEVEAIEPIDILKRGGVDVTTVGVKSKTVTGAHGIEVTADIEINEVEPEKMELLMLPGGIGHEIRHYFRSARGRVKRRTRTFELCGCKPYLCIGNLCRTVNFG